MAVNFSSCCVDGETSETDGCVHVCEVEISEFTASVFLSCVTDALGGNKSTAPSVTCNAMVQDSAATSYPTAKSLLLAGLLVSLSLSL